MHNTVLEDTYYGGCPWRERRRKREKSLAFVFNYINKKMFKKGLVVDFKKNIPLFI